MNNIITKIPDISIYFYDVQVKILLEQVCHMDSGLPVLSVAPPSDFPSIILPGTFRKTGQERQKAGLDFLPPL
jgi:hypothetical protein